MRWWNYDYDDGAVWPCRVIRTNMFGTLVEPLAPAPDAGEQRVVSNGRVLSSDGDTAMQAREKGLIA